MEGLTWDARCSSFVLMLHGHPISASLPEDLGLGERFWYWRGASGQSYIHSIYSIATCPPLAGAVFLVVRKHDGNRRAIAAGRFPSSGAMPSCVAWQAGNIEDEIHVHLLARDPDCAERVLMDLSMALEQVPLSASVMPGFCEPVHLELLAA